MRLNEFFLKLNGKFKFLRTISQRYIKKAVLNPKSRKRLNNFYHGLSYYEKSIFHALYSRLFRDGKTYDIEGEWTLKFAGREIKMPLSSDSLWLDWETAVSILGHDYEIKQFYEKRIKSNNLPKCFLDIGANFGTHSLLFLATGIKAVSIEPNPECKSYFERMLSYNGLKGNWNAIGLGKEEGKAELVFPVGETWLGTLNEGIKESLSKYKDIRYHSVEIKTLDNFINSNNLSPDLIKIDTEGYEEEIINGGNKYFNTFCPEIIFEANSQDELELIGNILNIKEYSIFELKSNSKTNLKNPKSVNFIAKKILRTHNE